MTTNKKVFHLWLSTKLQSPVGNLAVPITQTAILASVNSVAWNVDFDSLFRGWNKKFKRCSIRFSLKSDSWTSSALDWENYQGVLTITLPSDTGSTTNFGTALGLIFPSDVPTTGTSLHCYNISTLGNQEGADVLVPQSNQIMTINFVRNGQTMGLIEYPQDIPDYQIMLLFELSEPIEEQLVKYTF